MATFKQKSQLALTDSKMQQRCKSENAFSAADKKYPSFFHMATIPCCNQASNTIEIKKISDIQSSTPKKSKSKIIAITLLTSIILILLYDINIQLGSNEACWEQFKKLECDFMGRTGKQDQQCEDLKVCVSSKVYSVNLFSILAFAGMVYLAIQKRKRIMVHFAKGFKTWEQIVEQM